jgi:hypothetical protein
VLCIAGSAGLTMAIPELWRYDARQSPVGAGVT